MGLDIRISRAEPIYCPHCGELVTYRAVDTVDGGGSWWYEFLFILIGLPHNTQS